MTTTGENSLSGMVHLLTMAETLKHQNETLQSFIQFLQTQMPKEDVFTYELPYFWPMSEVV